MEIDNMEKMDVDVVISTPDYKEEGHSPLVKLPAEIWKFVLKKLEQKDVLALRLANKKLKTLASNLYEWTIELDERCPYLQTLTHLRVKKVKVVRLMESLPTIFNRPELLYKLESNGYIHPHNLGILMKSCCNLRDVSLILGDCTLNSPTYSTLSPPIGFELKHLTKLNITISHTRKEEYFVIRSQNMIYRILGSSTMPKLNWLRIVFCPLGPETLYKLSLTLLKFLGSHGQVLKYLEVGHQQPTARPFEGELDDSFDSCLVKSCSTLETLKIDSLEGGVSDVLKDTWLLLIKCQTNLKHLYLRCLNILSPVLENVVISNSKTLCSISINHLVLEKSTLLFMDGVVRAGCFDMSVFGKSQNLESLELKTLKDYYFMVPRPELSTLDHLQMLPEKLERLSLDGFLVLTEQIFLFVSSHLRLKSLHFYAAGSSGTYGFTGSVLEVIFNSLECLESIFIDSSSMNLSPSDPEEAAKLLRIFNTFGYRDIAEPRDRNFRLLRETRTSPWIRQTSLNLAYL